MGLDQEKLELASDIILGRLELPRYYRDFVNAEADLYNNRRDSCYIHDEEIPSFTYYQNTDTFYCWGCKRGGNVIHLHMHMKKKEDESFSYVKAVLDLSSIYNIEIPNIFSDSVDNEIARRVFGKDMSLNTRRITTKPNLKSVDKKLEKSLKLLAKLDMDKAKELYFLKDSFEQNQLPNDYILEKLLELDNKVSNYLRGNFRKGN